MHPTFDYLFRIQIICLSLIKTTTIPWMNLGYHHLFLNIFTTDTSVNTYHLRANILQRNFRKCCVSVLFYFPPFSVDKALSHSVLVMAQCGQTCLVLWGHIHRQTPHGYDDMSLQQSTWEGRYYHHHTWFKKINCLICIHGDNWQVNDWSDQSVTMTIGINWY